MWIRVFAALALAGCSASMVNPPGAVGGGPNAPVNEAERPGVVSYRNQGASSFVRARREDAYRQMHEACGGPYRIDAEGPHSSGGTVVPVGNSAMFMEDQRWFIQFSCVRPTAAR